MDSQTGMPYTDLSQHNLLMHCPRCRSKVVAPSGRRWYDVLFSLVRRRPFRCLSCFFRFHRRPLQQLKQSTTDDIGVGVDQTT